MANYSVGNVRIQDNSAEVTRVLEAHLASGTNAAIELFYDKLKSSMDVWGSDFLVNNWRVRLRHSSPGNPPFKQTGNLFESIAKHLKFRKFGKDKDNVAVYGAVFTDVPYAPTLELGSPQVQVNQDTKQYTNFRLANPFLGAANIEKRDIWLKIWNRNLNRMLLCIKRGG